VHIGAEAANTEEAKKFIEKLKPDILFLDINMPNQTGIEFLEENYPLPCHVIFTTAYDEHAIKAFRLNAIDYLLKPINPDDLLTAIEKVKRFSMSLQRDQIVNVKNHQQETNPRMAIPTMEGIYFITVSDIIWLESAQGSYTKIKLEGNKTITSSRGLGEYEEILSAYNFLRVHHQNIVNTNKIARYIKGNGGQLIMNDEYEIEVSRRKKDDLLQILNQLLQ
jgi:two-component system LytT family response regulator